MNRALSGDTSLKNMLTVRFLMIPGACHEGVRTPDGYQPRQMTQQGIATYQNLFARPSRLAAILCALNYMLDTLFSSIGSRGTIPRAAIITPPSRSSALSQNGFDLRIPSQIGQNHVCFAHVVGHD